MMTHENQWKFDRLENFTSSQIHRLMESGAGGNYFGKDAMTYIREIVAEMLTGEGKPSISNFKAIKWGNDHEAEAMAEYIAKTGRNNAMYFGKETPVFFPLRDLPAGGSPDGLIENERVIEFKCPYDTTNHIEYSLMTLDVFKKSHKDYYAQCQLNMVVTNTMFADFCSYDPRIVIGSRLSILEVPFDKEFCVNMLERIRKARDVRDTIYNSFIIKAA